MVFSKTAGIISGLSLFFVSNQGLLANSDFRQTSTKMAWDQKEQSQAAMQNNPLCRIISESTVQEAQALPVVESESKQRLEINQGDISLNLSQKLVRVLKRLFSWSDTFKDHTRVKASSQSVMVIGSQKSLSNTNHQSYTQEYNLRQRLVSYTPEQTQVNNSYNSLSSQQEYRVVVRGYPVAKLKDQEQANLLARRWEYLISEPDFDPQKLEPALIEGQPGGKMRDRTLFVIDQSLNTQNRLNNDLLAIEWINNLRIAFKTPPLKLIDAQQQMYGVVETKKAMQGLASWYGPYFHGRLTANGETYNQYDLTAAHPNLPLNTYLKVTNLNNDKSVIIRLNDRGPYIPPRSLDLSLGAARCLNSIDKGVIPYRAVVMQREQLQPAYQ